MSKGHAHRIVLDASLALSPRVEGGVPQDRLLALQDRGAKAVEAVMARAKAGELGFWNLPEEEEVPRECVRIAKDLAERFKTLVVFGIGGSSLGGRMLHAALAPDYPDRVVFVDNVDPHTIEGLLESIDLETTCFNIISKSGGTVETAAQFVLIRDRLRQELGEEGYRERTVATTDPEKGLLFDLATEEGLQKLPIPHNVGGRFSVLTAVGLLPAAFLGIDLDDLLAGAHAMRERCAKSDLKENPALLSAAVHYLADTEGNRPIHVMMPYCDRLKRFGEWYGQLWAESLGKRKNRAGDDVHLGPTPVCALGATDQHSQVQLYAEGPHDKLMTFLVVDEPGAEAAFPEDLPESYQYLRGHTMASLLDAERRGTTYALARLGRPSVTIHLDRLDASNIGGLIFLYEAQTAFAGELYDIDAFDQPGVEMGKLIAFALMGRAGYADALDGLEPFTTSDDEWTA